MPEYVYDVNVPDKYFNQFNQQHRIIEPLRLDGLVFGTVFSKEPLNLDELHKIFPGITINEVGAHKVEN